MRRVLLVRHGRTAWNAQGRFQGQADPPLDDVGLAQAYELAPILAAVGPQVIVSSDAVRARETAEVIADRLGLPLLLDARLRERHLGEWQGLTPADIAQRFPAEHARWRAGHEVQRRGGEQRTDVAARALASFAELPDVPVALLVSHGATINALVSRLLGLDLDRHLLGGLANCHWSELVTDAESAGGVHWRLRGHNLGAPGAVVPLPVGLLDSPEDVADADA